MGTRETIRPRDWLNSPWVMIALWVVPWIVIAATSHSPQLLQTIGWTASFAVMGAACVINARQCRRRHCFVTGPVYLLAALASLLLGLRILPIGRYGWGWIVGVAIGVTLLACCCLEAWFGKYAASRSSNP